MTREELVELMKALREIRDRVQEINNELDEVLAGLDREHVIHKIWEISPPRHKPPCVDGEICTCGLRGLKHLL
jgi:hypothetical protein